MKTITPRAICRFYLHPAVVNRALVAAIQKDTGCFLLIKGQKSNTAKTPHRNNAAPWGGDTA